jgi:hypothetical protein
MGLFWVVFHRRSHKAAAKPVEKPVENSRRSSQGTPDRAAAATQPVSDSLLGHAGTSQHAAATRPRHCEQIHHSHHDEQRQEDFKEKRESERKHGSKGTGPVVGDVRFPSTIANHATVSTDRITYGNRSINSASAAGVMGFRATGSPFSQPVTHQPVGESPERSAVTRCPVKVIDKIVSSMAQPP